MLFTDYYAEASCTAGRANFITGELPIRTGHDDGRPGRCQDRYARAEPAPSPRRSSRRAMPPASSARIISAIGIEFLPTVHGFDEFFGYLYHLDAMEDPSHPNYPQDALERRRAAEHGPLLGDRRRRPDRRCRAGARSASRRSRMPASSIRSAWRRSTTRSSTWRSTSSTRPKRTTSRSSAGSTRRACTSSPISRQNGEATRNSENGWSRIRKPAWPNSMPIVGLVLQKLKEHGRGRQHDRRLQHRQRHRDSSPGPMAAQRRSRSAKGRSWKAASACRASCAGPVTCPADSVQNGIFSGLDWFPTFLAAAGNPDIIDQLLKGVQLGDRTYKNHLDGYNQMDAITGKGPSAASRNLLPRRKHRRCGAYRRLQVSLHRPARRLAG